MHRADIKAYAEQRRIPHLVHFTRSDNLLSILSRGVLSRATLGIKGIPHVVNDVERWDKRAYASCLSVSFPNYKMLHCYREANKAARWVILLLDVAVLWEIQCGFCRVNAARREMAALDGCALQTLGAFKAMFAEKQDRGVSRSASMFPFDPTDVQAEVLAFEEIGVHFIKGICFERQSELRDMVAMMDKRHGELVSLNPALFGSRDRARRVVSASLAR